MLKPLCFFSQVTSATPLPCNDGTLGRKTSATLMEIERNRQILLAKQGEGVRSSSKKDGDHIIMKQNTTQILAIKGKVLSKQVQNQSLKMNYNPKESNANANYNIHMSPHLHDSEKKLDNTLSPISCDIFGNLVHPTSQGKTFRADFQNDASNSLSYTPNKKACNGLENNFIAANSISHQLNHKDANVLCPKPLPRTSTSLTLKLLNTRILDMTRYFPEATDSPDQGNKASI